VPRWRLNSRGRSQRYAHLHNPDPFSPQDYRTSLSMSFLLQSSGDSGANVKRLEEETTAKIELLNQQAASISPDVIQMLLRHVTTVKN